MTGNMIDELEKNAGIADSWKGLTRQERGGFFCSRNTLDEIGPFRNEGGVFAIVGPVTARDKVNLTRI